jgi:hypothetical protein
MTAAERMRRWRKRHALPQPEWTKDIPVFDPVMTLEDVFNAKGRAGLKVGN